MSTKNIVLAQIEELRETSDIAEVAQLLNSGNWIAICATTSESPVFCLGRLREFPLIYQANTLSGSCQVRHKRVLPTSVEGRTNMSKSIGEMTEIEILRKQLELLADVAYTLNPNEMSMISHPMVILAEAIRALSVACPSCKAVLRYPEDKFCVACGHKLK